jgi:hypothetical protein
MNYTKEISPILLNGVRRLPDGKKRLDKIITENPCETWPIEIYEELTKKQEIISPANNLPQSPLEIKSMDDVYNNALSAFENAGVLIRTQKQ